MGPELKRGLLGVLVFSLAAVGLLLLRGPAKADARWLVAYPDLRWVLLGALLVLLLMFADRALSWRSLRRRNAEFFDFRQRFERNADALILFNDKGGVIDANERALSLYGYERTRMLAADAARLSSAVAPYTAREALNLLQRALKGEDPVADWQAKARDGRVFWVELRLRSVLNRGAPQVLASIRDISRRKLAELEAAEREARFRGLVEGSPHLAVAGYDAERRVIYWNPACEQLYGYRAKEALGQRIEDLIVAEAMRGRVLSDFASALRGDSLAAAELHLRHRDGRSVFVYSDRLRLLNGRGEAEVFCLDVDLSVQERALNAVQGREHAMQLAAVAALELLRQRDTDAALSAVLERVGSGMQVDRIYLCEILGAEDGVNMLTKLRFSWGRAGSAGLGRADWMQDWELDTQLPNWADALLTGLSISASSAELAEPERSLLQAQGVQSTLVVPIMMSDRAWGFIAFDAIREPRPWSQADEGMLHIVGACFAAAIERRRADAQLRQNAKVFECTHDGVLVTDLSGNIVAVNAAFCAISGYGEFDVIGRNPRLLRSGRHEPAFYTELWADLQRNGHWQGEVWNRRKTGEVYPQWLDISTVLDDLGRPSHYVGVGTDITQLKQSEAQLQRLAHHDPLTGLPNRLLAQLRLEHAVDGARRTGSKVAVIFIDLDGFKQINDSLGHRSGDLLLIAATARFKQRVRTNDTLARLGGDEFLIIAENLANAEDAAQIAGKIIKSLEVPFNIDGHEAFLGASAGISLFPDDSADHLDLIRNADTAMYQAKTSGRNQLCFYTAEMNAQAMAVLELNANVRNALQFGRFELHFQPKYQLQKRCITGFEALLRMRAADGSLVPPDRFIAMAERTGLIVQIGTWVLNQACLEAKRWHDHGHPEINIAVNVSVRQFRTLSFIDDLKWALQKSGLPAAALELELTETMLMDDPNTMVARLKALKALGIRLALDDFGTGYSSLGYLLRFPIDVLKIDKSFINNLGKDAQTSTIVTSILDLSRRMQLKVVAEGVETQAQAERLRDLGCDEIQGYLLSRPLPGEQALEFLAKPLALNLAEPVQPGMGVGA